MSPIEVVCKGLVILDTYGSDSICCYEIGSAAFVLIFMFMKFTSYGQSFSFEQLDRLLISCWNRNHQSILQYSGDLFFQNVDV